MAQPEQFLIKFSVNQIGVAVDYWHEGDWRGLELIKSLDIDSAVSAWIAQAKAKGAEFSDTRLPYQYLAFMVKK